MKFRVRNRTPNREMAEEEPKWVRFSLLAAEAERKDEEEEARVQAVSVRSRAASRLPLRAVERSPNRRQLEEISAAGR